MPYISTTTRAMASASGGAQTYARRRRAQAYKHDGTELSVMDWFAGVGGSTQGADAVPGVKVTRAANHWKQAIASHERNFPGVAHYIGDIRKAPVWAWPITDIHWGSPECFPAGTMILTRRGMVPIEDVEVGDEVFTHERRWRPVTTTMRKMADTVLVKGVGHAGGIETTAEHPFLTRRRGRVHLNKKQGYQWRLTSEPAGWTEAKNLDGHMWATPLDFGDELPVPEIGRRGGIDFTPEFWWLVGRWLGDGSLRLSSATETQRPRFDMIVTCGHHEADELGERLDAVLSGNALTWQRREQRTATVFTTTHRGLVEWLVEHFGQHSYGKTVPAWAFTMPVSWREGLLDGYLSADGSTSGRYTQMSTVSRRLALGLRMLANTLGHVANLSGPYTRKGERQIEGRAINERPQWMVTWITDGPSKAFHIDEGGYRWAPVKTVEPTGRQVEVFNISVAEDESYMADGVIVHNCTKWSIAQGKKRDFAKAVQGDLLDLYAEMEEEQFQTGEERDNGPTEEEAASRALMEEIPLYLRGVIERGGLVKAGVVENVVDVRQWFEWDRWVSEFHKMGYRTRLVALNSMHADPRSVNRAPQSRDRLYFVYWHRSLGRNPNFEKWLAPSAFCTSCGEMVKARQVFRRPGVDMGRYKSQYDYRCPNTKCGHRIVEPETLPAAAAIDWSIAGGRIGDRDKPLAEKTMRRIQAGLDKFARPMMVPTGGTWRDAASDVLEPMPTRTTRENDALAVPPLLVPCDGREGKNARPIYGPMQTQTTRAEAGLAWLPFITEIRGGSSDVRAITDPLATVCASGNHHGLAAVPMPGMMMRNNGSTGNGGEHCTGLDDPMRTLTTTGHQSLVTWGPFLAPYYGNGTPRPVSEPVGALSTRDRYALVTGELKIEDVLFRMLQPHEIQRAMAFADDYVVLGSKRDRVRQLGNAVTPPAAEILICLLAECITGEEISRYDLTA
ncbi:DNA cytosine methyltransferase [Streptomyces sp. NBC_01728]|uniref:Hint domain-containing protein n=1 Tax=unclassified Streptomyces TaxID=2593676 RepID=UPI00225A4074|nr:MULTISPECIES: Hint domain-containing protein [unclassified Streptomyces]MCX4458592.1 DNA cytosine methyltransferase [Streptomyces sp. NBC_01719]MCX4497949.1 DNA cytosine methyltransferase [Streptomyces sp. NBC_01728]